MSNFWGIRKIYPSVTTTPRSDWRGKIDEIKKFGLTEVCLFPTFLKKPEREELYRLLENSPVKKIPLVHLREEDMETDELDYLNSRFQIQTFNVHSPLLPDFQKKFSPYIQKINIENHPFTPLIESELKKAAGICVDFSHLEDARLMNQEVYKEDLRLMEIYSSGCSHISAITESLQTNLLPPQYSSHYLNDLKELDYLKNYPAKYFPPILAIELENSLKEQLKIKEYITRLLK